MDRLDAKAIKTYKEIILILDQCIDDYLFVMDLDKDIYFISPHAMKNDLIFQAMNLVILYQHIKNLYMKMI